MKKLLFIFICLSISFQGYSQYLNPNSYYNVDDVKNRFYIRGGISTPAWKYYGYPNASELKKNLNIVSKIGANLEIGSIFTINKLKISPGLRLGVNVDYISFKAHVFNLPGSENLYNLFIGSKVGPSLTYMPERGLSFDIFAKIVPVWVGSIYYNQQDFEAGLDTYLAFVQPMFSFGFNAKITFLVVGFEYEIGSLRLKNNSGDYWGDYSNPSSTSTPMPGFNLTVGLSF